MTDFRAQGGAACLYILQSTFVGGMKQGRHRSKRVDKFMTNMKQIIYIYIYIYMIYDIKLPPPIIPILGVATKFLPAATFVLSVNKCLMTSYDLN